MSDATARALQLIGVLLALLGFGFDLHGVEVRQRETLQLLHEIHDRLPPPPRP